MVCYVFFINPLLFVFFSSLSLSVWRFFMSVRSVATTIWNMLVHSSSFRAVEIYLSPVETHCSNVDYFPDLDDEKALQPNDDAITRLHLARSCVALFILRWVTLHIHNARVCCWCDSMCNLIIVCVCVLGRRQHIEQWPKMHTERSFQPRVFHAVMLKWFYVCMCVCIGKEKIIHCFMRTRSRTHCQRTNHLTNNPFAHIQH